MHYHALILSILLISIGIVGVLSRRNLFIVYMSIELMLNGINLGFVTASSIWGEGTGNVISLMIMAIAAAEAALFLAMVVLLFRHRSALGTDDYRELASEVRS